MPKSDVPKARILDAMQGPLRVVVKMTQLHILIQSLGVREIGVMCEAAMVVLTSQCHNSR